MWGCLMSLCLLCVGAIEVLWYVPQIGRIGGFRALAADTAISGTNYVISFKPLADSRANIWLENRASQSKISLFGDTYMGYSPSFATFKRQDRLYLITRADTGSSAGGRWYRVYDISLDIPQEQTTTDRETGLMAGTACNDPKLDEEGLLFEGGEKCWIFGFIPSPLPHEYQYHLKLELH